MAGLRWLFGSAVFLAAFLLFLVEPIAAKQLLPVLGGSAAVWITCLVFFQSALLAAYLFAHWMAKSAKLPVYLALLFAGLGAATAWAFRELPRSAGSVHPFVTVFSVLAVSIGVPFVILGSTSPLLQVWWSRTLKTAVPYKLFALSNFASLLALLVYPWLVEPHLTLGVQRAAWCGGFAVFCAMATILSLKAGRPREPETIEERAQDALPDTEKMGLRQRALWVLLPMGAAMQLSAVTSYMTANVAAIPLLWILPLAVYLITLILAFEFPRFWSRKVMIRFLVLMLASLGYMLAHVDTTYALSVSIGFFLVELFVAALFCHAEACALRPAGRSESTVFYLLFAAGGALGSAVIGIVSPMVFRFNYDLVLAFCVTALLALAVTWSDGWNQRMLWGAASAGTLVLAIWVHAAYAHDTTVAVRNFYGALRVRQNFSYPGATVRVLSNGLIQHGTQIFGTDEQRRTPTSYYATDSGVGLALRYCCEGRAKRIGVIGLGTGTVAAYGQPGDRIRFYEINPAVEPIARNVFSYIRESAAQVDVVTGDARRSLEENPPQGFDVLVIDAFSGDAIPLHLLTTEAMKVYRRNLAPGGVLAFHISNSNVDLEGPVTALARTEGMAARKVSTFEDERKGEFTATWILCTDNDAFLNQPEIRTASVPGTERAGETPWTDDYSSLLPYLHW